MTFAVTDSVTCSLYAKAPPLTLSFWNIFMACKQKQLGNAMYIFQ